MKIGIATVTKHLKVRDLVFLSCLWWRCSLWLDLCHEVPASERSDTVGASSFKPVIDVQTLAPRGWRVCPLSCAEPLWMILHKLRTAQFGSGGAPVT